MSTTSTTMLRYLPIVFLLAGQAVSKHSHHHHVRQVAVAVPITSNAPPSTTIQATRVSSPATSEIISDIQDIQEGLDDLPGDLLSYIQYVEQRLETVEALLQSLLSSSTPTSVAALPSASAVSTSSILRGPAPFSTTAAAPASTTTKPASITSSISFHPTTFRTSRVTSTKTSVATVTRHIPIPVFSTGALPRPYSYAPVGNGTLAKPTAASASGTGPKIVTRTVAVLPVPSTITLPGSLGVSAPTTFATLVRTA